MSDELRRRAQVRAIAFFDRGDHAADDHVERMTRLLVDFVHEALVGDIGDGPFIHWLAEQVPRHQLRYAPVACGRTFNMTTREGRYQASRDLRFVTCPKCRTIAVMQQPKEEEADATAHVH